MELYSTFCKIRNTETGNGMRGMHGTWGIFTKIPGNVIVLTSQGMFWGMFEKIPGKVRKDFGKFY